ncbi:hypothetical protein MI149_29490 (plasmid) [Mycolicibacterium crocinum]|uniref:Uncharacterized protein n=2 Tax=Mycolicibacterium TaxID=1866885 RepID=A0A064C846_9MYCO|nr:MULTISPECIES: hypothetical protein [Mycolicibacterium]KDE96784.1 hypothetical protein Y900_029545 [Mycolicibacterium aromaticivorans JS19b1 = JCM 16368]ULN44821.1 hypothetical protein MI149_29490 [Mycolicibacterium crocinum]
MHSQDSLADFKAGLRCGDVHAGLRNVDPNSSTLAPLSDTRLIGMAASLASLIRGQDIIADAESLKTIVAEQLDVSPYAFRDVVDALERADMVSNVHRSGQKIVSFNETVPIYEDLYDRLGGTWRAGSPSTLEQQMVAIVDRLATSPVPAESLEATLGLDRSDIPRLLELGKASQLVKSIDLIEGEILYSPFFGFENPELLATLMEQHGSGRFAEELQAVRAHQGLPLDADQHPALADAIARGFILAPSVQTPGGHDQPFAAVPYVPDASLLTVRKPVLDKALAVLACVRCGEHFGGATSTKYPAAVLTALLDPNRNHRLRPHSSHQRQYQLLYRMQIVDFVPSGNWVAPQLIATEDNLAAVRLARDLLTFGEQLEARAGDDDARGLLSSSSTYEAPLQTVAKRRRKTTLSAGEYRSIMDAAMGRSAL